jgi:hypothetical protein
MIPDRCLLKSTVLMVGQACLNKPDLPFLFMDLYSILYSESDIN